MDALIPAGSLLGAFELVCCFFTVVAAFFGCVFGLRF